MEIVNFFEKLAGRWFSQRTTHALSTQQSQAGKSDLEVEFLAPDAAEVQQLCQAHGETSPLCGLKIQQSSTLEGDSAPPKVSTALLVPLAPTPLAPTSESFEGNLLRSGSGSGTAQKSTYSLEDEVLTIISDGAEGHAEERLWFINDNLRMRTGLVERADGLRLASFCSEIRLGVKPPPAS
jgi:hypothetical protein